MPRFVAIGDSLTQGFQSGAISRTDLSYPAFVARVLQEPLRLPDFRGEGGLPMNLERLVRALGEVCGRRIDWWDLPAAILTAKRMLDRTQRHWEGGAGAQASGTGPLHHNLAVWGFEVQDAYTLSEAGCARAMPRPKDNRLVYDEIPELPMYRTARRVLNPGFDPRYAEFAQVDAAREIAESEGKIENLLVVLGANNVLGTCLQLDLRFSQSSDFYKLPHQRACNIWSPEHFERILGELFNRLGALQRAGLVERFFIGTVPPVTVAPLTRGVSPSAAGTQRPERDAAGYYEFYTHFWIWDGDFNRDPTRFPHITREDARTIDRIIASYNGHIRAKVSALPGAHVFDLHDVLQRLAFRRSGGKPSYRFPVGLVRALQANPATSFRVVDGEVLLDTRYLSIPPGELASVPRSDLGVLGAMQRRYTGGLFSLDGIHPTTVGYGVMAHELLAVMQTAGVPGADPALLPWEAIVAEDKLLVDTPPLLGDLRSLLGALQSRSPLAAVIAILAGVGAEPSA